MKYAIIDTETSGLFDFSKPADAEGQPRLASITIITHIPGTGMETRSSSFFIKPDGWTMSEDAAKIHGLTQAKLEAEGVPVRDILDHYANLVWLGFVIVAFNAQFDTKIMRAELRRAGMPDLFEQTPNICLMRACTDICRIPKKTGGGYKFPRLSEACAHFGIELRDAHTSLADAEAAAAIFHKLLALGALPAPEVHKAKVQPV